MTDRSVQHATFTVERHYPHPPERVFAAWADPVAKHRWFVTEEGWSVTAYELDFRVGGRERSTSVSPDGHTYLYDAVHLDIVTGERIITAYELQCDGRRMSTSLGTVQLAAMGDGTALTYTEQGAFLDGLDRPDYREAGTRYQLGRLAGELAAVTT